MNGAAVGSDQLIGDIAADLVSIQFISGLHSRLHNQGKLGEISRLRLDPGQRMGVQGADCRGMRRPGLAEFVGIWLSSFWKGHAVLDLG